MFTLLCRSGRLRIAIIIPTLCMWFLDRQAGLMNTAGSNVTSDGPLAFTQSPTTFTNAFHHSIQFTANGYPGQPTTKSYNNTLNLRVPRNTSVMDNQNDTTVFFNNGTMVRKPLDEIEWQHRRNAMDYLQQLFPGPPILDPNTTSSCQGERVLDEIQIHVITWKRATELAILLDTLQTADYRGYNNSDLPLYIHVDGGGEPEVQEQARNFTWKHGTKHLDIRSTNVGLREMWLTSLRGSARKGNNTLMLVLEDDMVLSPLYFQWLLQMVDFYARNPDCRDSNLVGFSLSPIIRQNMYKPFHNWSADQELGQHLQLSSQERRSVYLSTIPSSWGGAFWSDVWNQFDTFIQERVKPPLYDFSAEENRKIRFNLITPEILHLPHDCTTKTWTKSWKRFLVDFAYVRGLWTLYPNLPDNLGIAYARQTTGTHVNKYNFDRYKMDLVEDLAILKAMESDLPAYEQLLLVDLEHSLSSKEIATAQGTQFLNRIAKECKICQNVTRKWARPDWNVPSNGYDHFPLLCAADLYTSVATNALRPSSNTIGSGDMDRYLVITSPVVNRQDAKVWAALLNRRLILTEKAANTSLPQNSNTTESNLLNVWLSHYASLPVVTFPNRTKMSPLLIDDFLNQTNTTTLSPWRVLLLTSPSTTTRNMMVPEIDLRHLFSIPRSLGTMQHLLGGCADQVLVLNGLPSLAFESTTNLTIRLIEEKVVEKKPKKKKKPARKPKHGSGNVKGAKGKRKDKTWAEMRGGGKKKGTPKTKTTTTTTK